MDNEAPVWWQQRVRQALQRRQDKGNLRRLLATNSSLSSSSSSNDPAIASSPSHHPAGDKQQPRIKRFPIDFSSNDYLGLAHSRAQHELVDQLYREEITAPLNGGNKRQCPIIQHNNTINPNDTTNNNNHDTYSPRPLLGATGSRLLSGNSTYAEELEQWLASLHQRPAALLCNSGYDANLSVLATLPCDVVVYDAYVHNSIHMGLRLWQREESTSAGSGARTSTPRKRPPQQRRRAVSFAHNSVSDLQTKLQKIRDEQQPQQQQQQPPSVMIVVESVYSMDGDVAPLREMLDVAASFHAVMVVDEAHGLGVFGRDNDNDDGNGNQRHTTTTTTNRTLTTPTRPTTTKQHATVVGGTGLLAALELESHPALWCSIHTFGKAAGCHGAVLCACDPAVKEYWINFAYPFIYSTALPLHSLVTIRAAYQSMIASHPGNRLRRHLFRLVEFFQEQLGSYLKHQTLALQRYTTNTSTMENTKVTLLPSTTPIQALQIPSNDKCTEFCTRLWHLSHESIRLYPIKSPTVPVGQERVRIVLHAHNSMEQVEYLLQLIVQTLHAMQLLRLESKL